MSTDDINSCTCTWFNVSNALTGIGPITLVQPGRQLSRKEGSLLQPGRARSTRRLLVCMDRRHTMLCSLTVFLMRLVPARPLAMISQDVALIQAILVKSSQICCPGDTYPGGPTEYGPMALSLTRLIYKCAILVIARS